ncbi:MAG: PQQ-binding-like beta-propeller repeat protein [Kofleriaceae bacterium]
MRSLASSGTWVLTALAAMSCRAQLPREVPSASSGSAGSAALPASAAPATPQPDDGPPPDAEIITDRVLAMNASHLGRPPSTFRTGHVTARAAPKPVKTAQGYEVKFGSAMITTPTVYDRKVLVSGGFNSRQLFAFEATTGKPVWGLALDDDGPSNPACDQGVCVINTESCTIFAIAADTGKHLWSWWLGDPLTSAPTIAGGRVFTSFPAAGTADGKPLPAGASHVLAAFDLQKGTSLWQLWLDSDVMSSPVAAGEFVYVTTFAGTVIKLEQATGKVRYAMKASATSAPVVQFQDGVESMYYTRRGDAEQGSAEEMIIRADHNEPKTRYKAARKKAAYIDKKVQFDSDYAVEASAADSGNGFGGGAPASANAGMAAQNVGVKSVSSMQGFQGSRVLRLGARNVNTMGDEVIATDAETGSVLWREKVSGDLAAGGALATAPVPAGNSILYVTLGGDVQRRDAANGKLLKGYQVGGRVRSQPVLAGGWIYIGTDDGRLVAIDTKDPTVDGWPTWGGNAQRSGVAPLTR